jgi:exopolysaccharide biosynthesis polyprenyl glycosylphosphotransferase
LSLHPEDASDAVLDQSQRPLDMRQQTPAPVGPVGSGRAARPRGWTVLEQLVAGRLPAPVAAATCCAVLAAEPFKGFVLALLAFICAGSLFRGRPRWLSLLPFMRGPLQLLVPATGMAWLGAVQATTGLPGLSFLELTLVAGCAWFLEVIPQRLARFRRKRRLPYRTVVIGSRLSAVRLARELEFSGMDDYLVIGRVATGTEPAAAPSEVPLLGTLGELERSIQDNGIDLLVMTSEAPRAQVFEELATTCLHLPVRLWELSSMYEEAFGHVPVAEINAAWFQYMLHPKYHAEERAIKRSIDLVGALLIALVTLPMVLVLAWLIRRDGGPVVFKQQRVGQGGRPIVLYKLRTMRLQEATGPRWAGEEDARITSVGRLLRSLHVDELPQLFNVLKGEMSLVGPRPEQPEFVARLEEAIPFYQRRHLLKPGLTGWAQVRCGYAGSDAGSAWKVSHDLYYLKHRSTVFDLAILAETVRTVFADRRFAIEMKWVPFVHGHETVRDTALHGALTVRSRSADYVNRRSSRAS